MKFNRLSRHHQQKKKNLRLKKRSFLFLILLFTFSSIRRSKIYSLFFFVSDSSSVISFEKSSAFLNSKKSEIVWIKKIKFLDEKIVIKSDVSNFCKTNSSSFSSLNDFCVEIIKIEEKEKKKRSFFCFEFFVIDFLFDCYQNCQKKNVKKMSFETFNQYRKSRLISNENDANLIQDVLEEKELSKSTSREKKTTSVTKKIVQLKSSTTVSSLQVLQMLFRWLIIMSASKISKTLFFDEYNITKFLD
jgi:hypothetical protein